MADKPNDRLFKSLNKDDVANVDAAKLMASLRRTPIEPALPTMLLDFLLLATARLIDTLNVQIEDLRTENRTFHHALIGTLTTNPDLLRNLQDPVEALARRTKLASTPEPPAETQTQESTP